jgi:hypothetical protein
MEERRKGGREGLSFMYHSNFSICAVEASTVLLFKIKLVEKMLLL